MTSTTWRLVALGLTAACIGLATWVYYRDWTSPRSPSAERAQADSDVRLLVAALGPGDGCPRCAAELVARTSPRHWLVRLHGQVTTRCFDLALDDFALRPDTGIAGLSARACRPGAQRAKALTGNHLVGSGAVYAGAASPASAASSSSAGGGASGAPSA